MTLGRIAASLALGLAVLLSSADGFASRDRDRDGDGVVDARDSCPSVPGLLADGCPPEDRDGDGVMDREDACVSVPGPPKNRGCADVDRDGDTVVDRLDRCPHVVGLVEFSGCKPPDQDGDGVIDPHDRCPDSLEVWNGLRDGDGCPDKGPAKIRHAGSIVRLDLHFDAKDGLARADRPAVRIAFDAVTELRAAALDVVVVAPYGLSYGDSVGRARRRGASVAAELVRRGLSPERVNVIAAGPDGDPRVELHLR